MCAQLWPFNMSQGGAVQETHKCEFFLHSRRCGHHTASPGFDVNVHSVCTICIFLPDLLFGEPFLHSPSESNRNWFRGFTVLFCFFNLALLCKRAPVNCPQWNTLPGLLCLHVINPKSFRFKKRTDWKDWKDLKRHLMVLNCIFDYFWARCMACFQDSPLRISI